MGTVEVLVFPRTYERFRACCEKDARIFVSGRVSLEDNKNAKLLADRLCLFQDVPQDLWLRFATMDAYREREADVMRILRQGEGGTTPAPDADAAQPAGRIVIYIARPRCSKDLRFPGKMCLPPEMIDALKRAFGEDNVTLVPGRARL